MRIWVVRVALDVKGGARRPRGTLRYKFSRSPDHGASRPDDMETEESIVGHAQAKGATFEEAAQASLLLGLEVVPLGSVLFVSRQECPT